MEKIDKMQTGFLDTPIHKLDNISKDLGCNIYIKRDDMTGYAFGGNKLRKLDYLLKDALDRGCDTLLTYGGPQTNHGRLTASVAARFGMKSIIIMEGKRPEVASGNIILDLMMKADLYFADSIEKKDSLRQEVIKEYESQGHKIYEIPVGGSSELGILGYFDAVEEINSQIDKLNIDLDFIVCGYGSAGTYGGLLLGQKYFDNKYKVIGISVSEKSEEQIFNDLKYINSASDKYKMGIKVTRDDLWIEKGFVGNGYNIPDEDTRKVIYYVAGKEAVILDPCYTGKAFRGMMNLIKKGKIAPNSNLLFIHTGGTPGIYVKEHLEEFQKELW
ncbi:MAG: D-cysteine desulfhydrase family protein [Bacillota bacterium]|nr:D-cysteine desulfhydrase family protein [Bacillota bacterium]